MSDAALQDLAQAAGLSVQWRDYRDRPQEVSADALRQLLGALELPAGSEEQIRDSRRRVAAESAAQTMPELLIGEVGMALPLPGIAAGAARLLAEDGSAIDLKLAGNGHARLPPLDTPGYYELQVGQQRLQLAIAPAQCRQPPRGEGRRAWGLAAQLYALRQDGDGGIGHFGALAALARKAGAAGADALAISPVHAMFSADVHHYSPYSPSSRLFLNVLHADPAEAFGAEAAQRAATRLGLDQALTRLQREPLVNWPEAASARLAILRALYTEAMPRLDDPADALGRDYRAFVKTGGARLREHATFEALHAAALARDAGAWHWRSWQKGWQDPHSSEVAAFAAAHAPEISFHQFMQWLADRGLSQAQAQARQSGMRIGLIADLAVGTSSGGSHVWSRQQDVLGGISVGAPPDELNGLGQDWGLTAFSPRALTQHGYQPFIETLRASLRHAGGLRIDHVLGLRRLWLVPEGMKSRDGAYLVYPLDDLLRLVALESWRHQAVIIGEDLGTVPEGFRDQMARRGVLGMQVLWFERDHGYFIEPRRWSPNAMSTTDTHDLPPVAGWWCERDLDWRAQLGQFSPGSDESGERGQRARDRRALWAAFGHAGVTAEAMPSHDQPQAAVDAAIGFVAGTPSALAMIPLEDVLGLSEQPNIPGTVAEHPNWRRRFDADAEALLDAPDAERRLAILRDARREP